jgi:nicotinate-nucleotide pyrophosphorylase (carboxylating)
MMKPSVEQLERLLRMALEEDAPWGDITSQTLISHGARVEAKLVAREAGVLCGEDLFTGAMRMVEPGWTLVEFFGHDGDRFAKGDVLATVDGLAQAILQAERVALNFVQRLSGIATMTASYVAETTGTKAHIVDTRKTTPGLRLLEVLTVGCSAG